MAKPPLSIQDEFLRRRRIAIPSAVRDKDKPTDPLGRQIIGEKRTLAPGEADNLPTYRKFFSRLFSLNDEAQKAEYDRVQECAANRRYLITKRIDSPVSEQGIVRVYLEWLEFLTVVPPRDPRLNDV